MSNWAIVIGVNGYSQREHDLKGAVPDALDVTRWLLRSDGGNVPHDQLRLLLSSRDAVADPLAAAALPAERKRIIGAINEVLDLSAGQWKRLFFYFAGHGMSARVDLANLSAILPGDFQMEFPDESISLRDLFDHFLSTRFEEQFFFFDACRDIVFSEGIAVGRIPIPRLPLTPPPPQYIMYATQAGTKALEGGGGGAGGAFTRALLAGLDGAGTAKSWHDNSGQYRVCWNNLFKYVREEVLRRKLVAGSGEQGPLNQEPREFGEHGSDDPMLAMLNPQLVNKATIRVNVSPSAAAGSATLHARDYYDDHRAGPPLSSPHELTLPPRTYGISAVAPGYERGSSVVELYDHCDLTLQLRPTGPTDPNAARDAVVARSLGGTKSGTPRPQSSVPLRVDTQDPLARVELSRSSGELISGRRGFVKTNVAPGLYRARVVSPEGDFTDKLFEVSGYESKVDIRAVSPVSRTMATNPLLHNGVFPRTDDGKVNVSEAMGYVSFLESSTLLALSAAAKIEGQPKFGHKLRSLPLPSFPELTRDASSGALVLFDDEPGSSERNQIHVRFFRQAGDAADHERPALETGIPHVCASTHELEPAPYWLMVTGSGANLLHMPITVLKDHVALIVVTRSAGRAFQVFQYQVPTRSGDPHPRIDPAYPTARFAALRRIELMQRSLAKGRISSIVDDLAGMLDGLWLDPIAACLGCHALVRLGRLEDAASLATKLTGAHASLADPWIVEGWCRLQQGRETSDSLKNALDNGCPLLRDGVTLLGRLLEARGGGRAAEQLGKVRDLMLPDSTWTTGAASLAEAWSAVREAAAEGQDRGAYTQLAAG
jgi:hypothetical protein